LKRKVIYLRVSREDLDESDQLPQITKTFNLKESECIILRERVSAYAEKSISKRTEFLKLKDMIEKEEVSDVYVYSLERIERNIIRTFEFFFYCEANECRIHGVLQPSLELGFEDSPTGTFSRYMQVLVYGLLGENESYMISKRTKKAVVEGDVTTSSYGNKWGAKFRDINGNNLDLPISTIESIQRRVKFLASKKYIAKNIVIDIEKRFNVSMSEMSVSRMKRS